MNKVILMGRLTRDPEVRYSQKSQNQTAVARYAIAVKKRYIGEGQQEADFINIVAFGKAAEFVTKWFRKGNMICVVGRITSSIYEKDGKTRNNIEVIAEEQHFTGGKHSEKNTQIEEVNEEDFPF